MVTVIRWPYVIQSFRDDDAWELFTRRTNRRWKSIRSVALRKLDQLEATARLQDLRIPPGNRLEALHGDRAGQHSIRINDQYRICFVWMENGAHDVELTDYHA